MQALSMHSAVPTGSGTEMAINRPDMAPLVWSALGNTADGKDWAMTALHPCGPVSQNQGIPDSSGSSTITPCYRGETKIDYDITMFGSPPSTVATTYSIEIVSIPIPEIDYIYRIRDDQAAEWSFWRVRRTDGTLFPVLPNNSVAAANPITGNTFRTLGYGKYRMTGKGHTLELDAPDLSNQGRITSGQLESIVSVNDGTFYGRAEVGNIGPLQGEAPYQATSVRVPNTSRFLVNGAPSCYQGSAKEGAYIVLKFVGPLSAQQYQNTGEFAALLDVYPNGATAVNLVMPETFITLTVSDGPVDVSVNPNAGFTVESSGQALYNAWITTGTSNTVQVPFAGGLALNQVSPFVSRPCDMTTSVTFIENIAVAASLRVKSRLFLENISTGAGAISPFAHRSPLLDNRALDCVATAAQQGMDAYPSRYNSFGDIMGKIWQGIKTVATPLLGLASKMPGIGGLIGNIGQTVIGGIDNLTGQVHRYRNPIPAYQQMNDLD